MTSVKDASLARIGLIRGLLSTVMVLGTIYSALLIVLFATTSQVAVAQYVIGETWFKSLYWVPSWANPYLAQSGGLRVAAAVAVAITNGFVVTAVFGITSFAVLAVINWTRVRAAYRARPEAVALSSSARQVIETPTCTLAIYDYSGQAIVQPAPEAHLWLRRVPLQPDFPIQTKIDRLKLALLEVLEAHADWTSGPSGHHAKVTIKPHSIAVAQMMIDRMPDDPLSPVIGLAHDLGKIIAYQRETAPDGSKTWVKTSRTHDHLSAHIVRVLPEFQAMDEVDRRILIAVLTYAHGRDEIPIGKIISPDNPDADMRIRILTRHIREADGITTRNDHASAAQAAEDDKVLAELRRTLPNALIALNINKSIDKSAKADGFSALARDYVAVLESHLREKLAPLLPEDLQAALAIRTPPQQRQTHPAMAPILKVLDELGWLMKSYRDMTPSPPLFAIQSGNLNLRDVILISREALEREYPDQVNRWGDAEFPLKIRPLK